MQTIYELKEQPVTQTPLLVFDCVLADGSIERWSTHQATVDGNVYEARILQHNVFEIQTASEQGVDGIPRISIVLANADSHFSEIERATGWKGARLKAGFLFYDLRNQTAATETSVVFQGVCNPPDEIREATFRITATNRMNLQRVLLPQVRIQRRCPWEFPTTVQHREEAVAGGANGKYSRFYRCGYSAGAEGGTGTLNAGSAFAACGYTRGECEARGMFSHFGGIEFVPAAISVRSYGDKNWHTSAVATNAARYNDFVPLVYGTAWYAPPLVFARNDGNLTRMEVLLGMGEMQGVLTVLVNDVQIPAGVAGTNMTSTGWYNIPTLGTRAGTVNADFPEGDPYGSMAYLSVVVPNRLNDGTSLPRVRVLAQGMKLPTYGTDGVAAGEQFTSNPAWIVLDVLRRAGWSEAEIDAGSFARAASVCDETIPAVDLYGNPISLPRFQCNVALTNRRSAGDLVRGVRNAGRLLLTYGPGGLLQARVENAAAAEQSVKPAWSNSTEPWNNGWPSYEFGDGSNGFSGILRNANGEPSVRVFSRTMADTPNRYSVEFQDGLNEYQQDSFSLVDPEDVARSGQEVSATLNAIGIPNYDQAGRILKLNLDKSVRGNTYIEFDTSVKAFGVRPADLITVTYLKEGFNRQAFRVLKIAPGANHRVTTITAQIHDDAWYTDGNGQGSAPGNRRIGGAGTGVPRPLLGSVVDDEGEIQFGVEEEATSGSDGSSEVTLSLGFVTPEGAGSAGAGVPLLDLAPEVSTGGTLQGGQTLYYAISGVDDGGEGGLSFVVRATVPQDGSKVTLHGLSFPTGTSSFRVYRGTTPAALYRIATEQALATQFEDPGLVREFAGPPDPNFDHANFYWRMELQSEAPATVHSANTVGHETLQMKPNRYRGALARVTRGRGAGQDRAIVANSETTLSVSPAWDREPDADSFFAVVENGWKFGAMGQSSPVRFAVPNRGGEVVELMGRAANVNDLECAAELSTVTRWQIAGSGDEDVAPEPAFGLSAGPRGGTLQLSGVSFPDLKNTRTISAGTLTVYYRDELSYEPDGLLAMEAAADAAVVFLAAGGGTPVGSMVQVEREVMRVEERLNGGLQYRVARGIHGTTPAVHGAGEAVYRLLKQTAIVPFPAEFFGTPYSGSWSFPIALPDARVPSAELLVRNAKGDSKAGYVRLTQNDDMGLRTLSGGQYSIQVAGCLAVDQSAAPALVVEKSHAVRDVYAVLGKAADAEVRVQLQVNGSAYCALRFLAGTVLSDAADGGVLPPLRTGDRLTLAVLSVGQAVPGSDLTVLIRL